MNTNKRMGVAALAAAISLLCSPAAWSLGLGEAKVESYLNQPLEVRIDLITNELDDLGSVSARLASADDYELIGASRESVPVPIRFTVMDPDGDAYLLATSRVDINDPVLRLIVEVNWASGRMLREYTLFLDPPAVPATPPPPRIDTRAAAVPAARTSAPAETARAPTKPAEAPARRVPVAGEYGPVANGETLWAIARDWARGTDIGINQAMIAIQRENPEAFLRGNINLLRRDAILRMPEVSEVRSIPASQAASEVVTQTERFRERAAAPDIASPSTPLLSGEAAAAEPPAETEAAAEARADETEAVEAEPAAGEVQGQLELVPPSEEEGLGSDYGFEEAQQKAGPAAPALRERLARTEEELINQQQQNEYLQQRIAELESEMAVAEGAAEDADMASMEQRLRAEREAAARQQPAGESPWYSGVMVWLIALSVIGAGVVGWVFRRRREGTISETVAGRKTESLRSLQGDAEDVLRTLDEDAVETAEAAPVPPVPPVPEAGESSRPASPPQMEAEEDAELLDEESADPEIQLDLARAYISMGDKEAARVILEEVISNGSAQQVADAQSMMEKL